MLSLTNTDGAESVRTRERFSEAFKKPSSSLERPMKAKVWALSEGGLPAKEAVVWGFASVPRFCRIADSPKAIESSRTTS